jgi:hypothetical protein
MTPTGHLLAGTAVGALCITPEKIQIFLLEIANFFPLLIPAILIRRAIILSREIGPAL